MGKVRLLVIFMLLVPLLCLWSKTLDYVYGTSFSSVYDGNMKRGDMFITDVSSVIVVRKTLEFDNQEDIVVFDSLYRAKDDFIPGQGIYGKRQELAVSAVSSLGCTFLNVSATTGMYPFKPYVCLGFGYGKVGSCFMIGCGVETTVLLGSLFESDLPIVANTGVKAWASPCLEISSEGLGFGLSYGLAAENRIGNISFGLGLGWLLLKGSSAVFSPSIVLEAAL